MTEKDEDVNVRKPRHLRQTSEYDEDEIDYFLVEKDGDLYQCWRRKVGNGGRPVGATDFDASDIRKVAEMTSSDEDFSRGEIAEAVGASKSWVQDRQRELLFL
jgi:hypothetical protein